MARSFCARAAASRTAVRREGRSYHGLRDESGAVAVARQVPPIVSAVVGDNLHATVHAVLASWVPALRLSHKGPRTERVCGGCVQRRWRTPILYVSRLLVVQHGGSRRHDAHGGSPVSVQL